VTLNSLTDYFYRDDSNFSDNIVKVSHCFFYFVDLLDQSGFLFESNNISLNFERTLFSFKSNKGMKRFSYFLNSTSKYLSLIFTENKINILEFDYLFFFQKTISNSLITLQKIYIDERFQGCLFYLNERGNHGDKVFVINNISLKNCRFNIEKNTGHFISAQFPYLLPMF
jgi:hypothetical protein